MPFDWIKKLAQRFHGSSSGKRLADRVRYGFLLAIAGFLTYQLYTLGLRDVLSSLPTHPLFYFLFALMFVALPVAETLVYKVVWRVKFWRSLPVFFRKRVYNKDMIDYSGEVYLYLWARKQVDVPDRRLLSTIKDNTIVSAMASTVVAMGCLALFFLTGQVAFMETLGEKVPYFASAGAIAVVVFVVVMKFRKSLFALPFKMLGSLFAIHSLRLLVVYVLQVLQWWIILPEVPLHVWFTFLALQIITNRIPLVPGRDLIYLSAGLELTRMLDLSSPVMAGMLLVTSVLDRGLNLILFIITTMTQRRPLPVAREVEPALSLSPAAELSK